MSVLSNFHSPAAERNKGPILDVLKKFISEDDQNALEIGTGTGQHALEFAKSFPNLKWTASDIAPNAERLQSLEVFKEVSNIEGPIVYECGNGKPPKRKFDIYYTANTFHIMGWKRVKSLFKDLEYAKEGARLFVYGPFSYKDRELEESNKAFHESLKSRSPESGIRLFEDVLTQAEKKRFSPS